MPSTKYVKELTATDSYRRYTFCRKSRALAEAAYYEMGNGVQLYDSPVYNSMEDLQDNGESAEV